VEVGVAEHLGHDNATAASDSIGADDLFLGLLALLFLLSIFRKGPRRFLTQVFGIPTETPSTEVDSCCSSEQPAADPAPGGG
jgi:hypothetical protein